MNPNLVRTIGLAGFAFGFYIGWGALVIFGMGTLASPTVAPSAKGKGS